MHTKAFPWASVLVVSAAASTARASEPLRPGYAWAENLGWIDLAPASVAPAQASPHFLSGFIRGEGFGWIHLGDGAPAAGDRYANDSPTDYGVNREGSYLSGWAWGENIGWIDFAPFGGPGMMLLPDGSLQGFAWSQTCGWIIFFKWGPTTEYTWQTIDLPDDPTGGGSRRTYTVNVITEVPPQDPEKQVLPFYTSGLRPQPRRILIRDDSGREVTDPKLQRRLLALARNAALYRRWRDAGSDRLDVLGVLGGFSEVEETEPWKFCGLIEIAQGTQTDFGHEYPGHLVFPDDYTGHGGDTRLVDWDMGHSALCVLSPLCYCDPFHPKGLRDYEQREKIYVEVLKHLVLQDGVDALDTAALNDILAGLVVVERYLRETEMRIDAADKVLSLIQAGKYGRVAFVTACRAVHFTREEMRAISRGFAPNNFSGWFNSLFPWARGLDRVTAFATKVSHILDWVNLGIDIARIPGEVFHFFLQSAAMQNHGESILQALDAALGRIPAAKVDPALLSALDTVKIGLGEGVPLLYREMMVKIAKDGLEVGLDVLHISLVAAAAVATGTIAGAPAGAVILLADGAIRVAELGVGFILTKLEKERLQQAVVLMATLERSWWTEVLRPELDQLRDDAVRAEALQRISWLASTRLYMGAFVGDCLLENNSGFIDWIRALLDRDFDAHRKEQKEFSARMARLMLGQGNPYAWEPAEVEQIAGRESVGSKHLGFCPAIAIDYLVKLAKPRLVENHTLTFSVLPGGGAGVARAIPGGGEDGRGANGSLRIGVTDPVGRRIGYFLEGDPPELREVNEIPGATLSGSGDLVISIPEPFDGDFRITLASDVTSPYTIEVTRAQGETVVATETIAGTAGPAETQDVMATVDTRSGSFEGSVAQPVVRCSVRGAARRASTLEAVEGARVALGDFVTTSAEDGTYTLADIPPGEYFLRVTKEAHRGFLSELLVLAPGEERIMDVELEALSAPVASLGGPYEGYVGEALTFDASGSTPGTGSILRYEWDFDGDGLDDGLSVEPRMSHVYTEAYEGRVFVRVVDSDGLSGSAYAEAIVRVRPGGLQVPGDANADARLDISDAAALLGFLFLGSPQRLPCGGGGATEPGNVTLLDWQPDQAVDISDAVSILGFLFLGGPSHPLAVPGAETTGCVRIAGCPDVCSPGM